MDIILELIKAYPFLSSVLFIIGALRVIFKPLFAVLWTYVEYTPGDADNSFLQKVVDSSYYKAVSWFLDYFGSIKLPK